MNFVCFFYNRHFIVQTFFLCHYEIIDETKIILKKFVAWCMFDL